MIRHNVKKEEGADLILIDFNVARKFRDPHSYNKLMMLTNTGAMAYVAPEIQACSPYK